MNNGKRQTEPLGDEELRKATGGGEGAPPMYVCPRCDREFPNYDAFKAHFQQAHIPEQA